MYINSTGFYIPSNRVHNDYFLGLNGLTDGWIYQRTGIRTRSKAGQDENTHTMGIEAVKNAIPKLPYKIHDVDLIIGASYTPFDTVATLAHIVQREFSITNAKAIYISSACSSFINAIEIAEGYFAIGKASKALIVCSEHNSVYNDEVNPKSGHLWGDAAAVVFISKEKQADREAEIVEINTSGLGYIGKNAGVYLQPRTTGLQMPEGREVFINACKYMYESVNHIINNQNCSIEDISYIIPHQANMRIINNISKQLNLPAERFLNNIEELGNTGSASSPLVLAQNYEIFKTGDKVILTVFGGGYSSGSCFIRF